jgi:16S rRNA processing protein RimM
MGWDEMALVGRIARMHGIRGQVIVNVETDFPDIRFRPGAELFVSRGKAVDRITLTTVRFHAGRPVIGIAGIETANAAEELAGLELRVPPEQLVELPEGAFYRHDLVGCTVATDTGEPVGIVAAVEGSFEMSRLVVQAGDDEILIPFVATICTAVDAAAKRIVIAPPEGLLDLNK